MRANGGAARPIRLGPSPSAPSAFQGLGADAAPPCSPSDPRYIPSSARKSWNTPDAGGRERADASRGGRVGHGQRPGPLPLFRVPDQPVEARAVRQTVPTGASRFALSPRRWRAAVISAAVRASWAF